MKRRFSGGKKVYLATQGVDMRKQINGLAAVVQGAFGADLYDGSMFVFCNSDKTIIKILCWDTDGFVLYHKRRIKGRFPWPKFGVGEDDTVSISENDMNRLLDGLLLQQLNIGSHAGIFADLLCCRKSHIPPVCTVFGVAHIGKYPRHFVPIFNCRSNSNGAVHCEEELFGDIAQAIKICAFARARCLCRLLKY